MPYLILVSFIWAFSFPLIKGNLAGLDSNFVSFARLLLAFLLFIPFIKVRKLPVAYRIRFAAIGAVQFGLMYATYMAAYEYLPAHVIALLTTTTPLFVTLANDCLSRRFHGAFLFAALLAVLAGLVIKYPSQAMELNIRGVLLLQISNCAFAAGQVWYKRTAAAHPGWADTQVFGLLYGGAVLVTGIMSLIWTDFHGLYMQFATQADQVTIRQAGTLLYLGLAASGICFFLWNKGARFVNTGSLAIMNNMKIPLAIIVSLMLLRENTDYLRLIAGCALMGLALAVNHKMARRAQNGNYA